MSIVRSVYIYIYIYIILVCKTQTVVLASESCRMNVLVALLFTV